MFARLYRELHCECNGQLLPNVVVLTRSMIRESRDCLKKNSGAPKCCACVAKPIVATIARVTSTNSLARDPIKELWKTVEMDP